VKDLANLDEIIFKAEAEQEKLSEPGVEAPKSGPGRKRNAAQN
jgi:hypothetical protein